MALNLDENTLKILVPVATCFIGFILGFLSTRFTMSKKERKDYQSSLIETSNRLSSEQTRAFNEFTNAINAYISKDSSEVEFNDFYSISTKGEIYFNTISCICDAIISNGVTVVAEKNTFLPKIKDTVEKILPQFYETLKEVSSKNNFPYKGELRRQDYMSIYEVYEKKLFDSNL